MNRPISETNPPTLAFGERIPYTKKPFLGKSRINRVIAAINALLRMKIEGFSGTMTPEGGFVFMREQSEGNVTGLTFADIYDPTRSYEAGTIVVTRKYVLCDDQGTEADPNDPEHEDNICMGRHATYIARKPVPPGNPPVWPEDVTDPDPFWRMLHVGVGTWREVEECDNGEVKYREIVATDTYQGDLPPTPCGGGAVWQ